MNKKTFLTAVVIFLAILIPFVWVSWFPSAKEPSYEFVMSWGIKGSAPGQFHDPTGIAIHNGEVYVADARNARIQVFDFDGRFKREIGSEEELGRPMNITIHSNKLYVVDYWNDRIAIYTVNGRLLKTMGKPGSGPGEFRAPGGVAVSSDHTLYVVDFYNQRVQHLTPEGGFINQIGITSKSGRSAGLFGYPTDIAISSDGILYVADGYNDRIQVFSSQGKFLNKWGGPFAFNISGPFNGWFAVVTSLALDSHDNVFAVDFYNHRVQKFDKSGTFLSAFGVKGFKDGQFMYPFGVAIAKDGSVFITDFGNNRVQKWSLSG